MVTVNTAQVASRAMLRDVLNRCKALRRRCGKTDEEEMANMSTGDPFRDKAIAFGREVSKTRELITARNAVAAKKGGGSDAVTVEESHEINRAMRELKVELDTMKALAEQAERKLAKANRQKKKPQTIALLEQDYKARQGTCRSCEEMLEGLNAADAARFETAKGGAKQMKIGAKFEREQLMNLRRPKQRPAGADGGDAAGGEGAEGGEGGGAGTNSRLEDNPETAEKMKKIQENDRKIDAALGRLGQGVGRLKDLAINIGAELDAQNAALTNTELTIDAGNKNLKQLNKRLKHLVEAAKPMNMAFNVGCFIMLLALAGYFAYEFGFVK